MDRQRTRFLGTSGTAEMLGVTPDRVRQLTREKRIPSIPLDDGQRIYERRKVERLAVRRALKQIL